MPEPVLLVLTFLFGAVIAAALVHLRSQRQIMSLREQQARLESRIEAEQLSAQQQTDILTQTRAQFGAAFSELSGQALKQNNDQFLRLAQENFKRHEQTARSDMDKNEQAVEQLIKPIKLALEKTEQQIQTIEKERREAYGSLSQQLQGMAESTRNLVKALRRPEVRGQWGELTLRRLAELAGMVDRCDFFEQETTNSENGRLRPDMVVRMPENREIVVDVKTPLDAYLSAMEAETDADKQLHLERHARNVRERVRELASKNYWAQFKNSPEFVVLFIPGDQFVSAAFDVDDRLLEEALQQKVIIATPTSFIALLRAVAFGWRQLSVAENAEQIRSLGEDMYGRLCSFGEHLAKMGRSLGSSVDHYNKAVGSLERKVLPGARKFTELGIHHHKQLPELDPIDKIVRATESSES